MIPIGQGRRWALISHPMECNQADLDGEHSVEARSMDVLVDLSADRPVDDRDLLVRFLW
jgi:hypothetical protein